MDEQRATSGQAPEAPTPRGNGQAERTSPGDQPGRQQQAEGQAPAKQPDKPGKVNLYDLPEFRQYQNSVQQTIAKEKQAREQAEKAARELKMAGLSDYEKAEERARQAEERLAAIEAERAEEQQMYQLQQKIAQDKMTLNRRFGIPLEKLDEAQTYAEAEEMAIEWFKTSLQEQGGNGGDSKAAARRAANRPNLGTGSREVSRSVEEVRSAWEGRDPAGYVGALLKGRKE